MLYLPYHLTNASALPEETENPEMASFLLNAACCFTSEHVITLKMSPCHSWSTLHCQNDRLCTPDRT